MLVAFAVLLATAAIQTALGPVGARAPLAPRQVHTAPGALSIVATDQDSTAIVVGVARPVGTIDAFVNGVFVGSAPANRVVRIRLRHRLVPGSVISVRQRGFGPSALATTSTTVNNDWLTYHYDNARDGWNPSEQTLNVSNVNASTFGELFNIPVDGNVYAEPLYGEAMPISGQGSPNVLYVATENDTVYAFDADTGVTYWQRSLADSSAGLAPIPSTSLHCGNVSPLIGITGTPVIDRSTSTMYLVAAVREQSVTGHPQFHMLHALDTSTGADKPGSPMQIAASMMMSDGTPVSFNSRYQLQRPGLLLSNGKVYLGFGSHCDFNRNLSFGWIMSFDATTLAPTGYFNTNLDLATPHLASVWQSGYGLMGDENGDVYFSTGNGPFDGDSGGHNWGQSIVHLRGSDLSVADYFTPANWATLRDKELGSGGVMMLPPQQGPIPNLLVTGGKGQRFWLLNRSDLGQFTPGGPNRVVQELINQAGRRAQGIFGGPAYYAGPNGQTVFLCANQDTMKAFALTTSPSPRLTLVGITPDIEPGIGGCIPSVSSDGSNAGTGIVWTTTRPDVSPGTIQLRAYDATNLSTELFSADAGPWFNPEGIPFMAPTVINGKVYVGTGNRVTVFGLKQAH